MRAQRMQLRDEAVAFIMRALSLMQLEGVLHQGRDCDPAAPGGTAIRFFDDEEATAPASLAVASDVAVPYAARGAAAGSPTRELPRARGSPARAAMLAMAASTSAYVVPHHTMRFADIGAMPPPPSMRAACAYLAVETAGLAQLARAAGDPASALLTRHSSSLAASFLEPKLAVAPIAPPAHTHLWWRGALDADDILARAADSLAARPLAGGSASVQAALRRWSPSPNSRRSPKRIRSSQSPARRSLEFSFGGNGLAVSRNVPAPAFAAEAMLEATEETEPKAPWQRPTELTAPKISFIGRALATAAAARSVVEKLRIQLPKRKGTVKHAYAELRSAARAERVARLVVLMKSDMSGFGLSYEDDDDMVDSLAEVVDALDGNNASGTIDNEASNFKHYLRFCEDRKTNVWRTRTWVKGDDVWRQEVTVMVECLLDVYKHLQRRPGYTTNPKPAAALAVLRGIRRAHLRLGLPFIELSEVAKAANTLTRAYVEKFGFRALLAKRAPPVTVKEISDVLTKLPEGASIGPWTYAARTVTGRSFRAATALLAQGGFRGEEVALSGDKKFGKNCLSRASIAWCFVVSEGSKVWVTSPTAEQLRNLKPGDLMLIIPPTSKADRFGTGWGNSPLYLVYSTSEAINAPREIAEIELALPCAGEARESTPLLTTRTGEMIRREDLAKAMRQALLTVGVPEVRAKALTLHSFRRYLACALLARKASPDTICALLRWRSTKSLAIYAQLTPDAYASLIADAANADVSVVIASQLPIYEREQVLEGFIGDDNYNELTAAAAKADEIGLGDSDDELD